MDFKSALADLLHGCVPELSAEDLEKLEARRILEEKAYPDSGRSWILP